MVFGNHEFGRLTKRMRNDFIPDATPKNSGEHTRSKYMRNPTDPSLNFLSNLNGTGENVETKLATETRRQHARRRRRAMFSQRREIESE